MVRPPRWYRDVAKAWLEAGDVPADPLADLNTTGNRLSVFLVSDSRADVSQIVAAHASTRAKPDDTGYILFDSEVLTRADISVSDHETGATADKEANARHRDLVDLSGKKLVALAREILNSREEPETLLKEDVVEILKAGVASGRIDTARLHEKVRRALET